MQKPHDPKRHPHLHHRAMAAGVLLAVCAAVWWLTESLARPKPPGPNIQARVDGVANAGRVAADADADSDSATGADTLHAAMRSTDARSLWWAATRLRECAGFRNGTDAYAAGTRQMASVIGGAEGASYRQARARMHMRCAMFSSAEARRLLTTDARRLLLTRAARAGSLPAELALLGERAPLFANTQYLDGLMERAARSRDADVARQMADVVLDQRLQPLVARHFAGMPADHRGVTAWLVTACSRGLDCSANGLAATEACASGAFMACNGDDFVTALMREQRDEADLTGVTDALHAIERMGD